MNMIRHAIYATVALVIAAFMLLTDAFALDNIIRPYQSLRSAGMGGVRLLTGLYDENFFGNPARVTANPKWKVQVFDVMLEETASTTSAVSKLVSGGSNVIQNIGDTAGDNLHGRIQTVFPAAYIPHLGKMSYALGLISSTQFDFILRNSYQVNPTAITDIGPALTVGRTFMDKDQLSIGVTVHATYRLASQTGYSFIDFIRGTSLSPAKSGGNGSMIDGDLGGTYLLPVKFKEWDVSVGAAIDNLAGGGYSNLPFKINSIPGKPPAQPRSYGFGGSLSRDSLGKFGNTILAFEVTDIGNNPNGSLFRTIHMGGETRWKRLRASAGINQGYLCAGFGMDLVALTLDFATYGEEMSLNTGGQEDRRYGVRIGFQI